MVLNLLINYYVLKELKCKDKYKTRMYSSRLCTARCCDHRGDVYPSMHWARCVYPSMHRVGGVYPSMHWAGGVCHSSLMLIQLS